MELFASIAGNDSGTLPLFVLVISRLKAPPNPPLGGTTDKIGVVISWNTKKGIKKHQKKLKKGSKSIKKD